MNNSGNNFNSNNTNKEKSQKIESIRVCIRARPLLIHEDIEFWKVDEKNNTISTINSIKGNTNDNSSPSYMSQKERDIKRVLMDSIYSPQNFTFDRIYETTVNSQLIYKEMCRNIIKRVISGYNGTIFMYGQTTSGKTFTMLGTPNSPGILPCTLRDIFNLISKENNPEMFNVFCSYIEIYNENLHDLLTDSNNLKLVDDSRFGVIVSGAKRVKIKSFEDGITLKDFGEENRKYRETLINEYSSRSHSIFQIFIESDGGKFSCLNLVDLAGSERLNDYDTKTEAFGETGHINKSLFVLANVVNKLAEGKGTYIPFRDSKLTRLISQALGGNSLTAVICTVSPAAVNYYQTLSTLRFATRAKIVKTKPILNEFVDDKSTIEFLKNEIKKLQLELKNKNNTSNTYGNNYNNNNLFSYSGSNLLPKDVIEHIAKTNDSLNNELETYKEKYFHEKERNDLFKNEIDKLKKSTNSINNFKNQNQNIPVNLNYDYSNNISGNSVIYKTIDNNNNIPLNSLNNELLFVDSLLYKITPQIEKFKNFCNFKEDTEIFNSEYKLDLLNLQNKYKEKVMENCIKNFPNQKANVLKILENKNLFYPNNNSNYLKEINSSFGSGSDNFYNQNLNSYDDNTHNTANTANNTGNINITGNINNNNNLNFNDDKDEVINKIKSSTIFSDLKLSYTQNKFENFEINLNNLKSIYEEQVDLLEKNMDHFKSYLENYYRKKIQKTRNNHLDNIELISENLPIISITSGHNEKLKMLRELYEFKLKELEMTFFDYLKGITASRMSKNT